jgi:hypothetical protein
MIMDSFPRLNTHADPGMGRVSVTVVRRGIGEPPYEGMGKADWWRPVVQERAELLPQRVWALRKGEHQASIDLKAGPASAPRSC